MELETRKAVVVHRGARDGYHVARALAERGLLESLVTDLYWPADRRWAGAVSRLLPRPAVDMLGQRWSDSDTTNRVSTCWKSGLLSLGLSKLKSAPFEWHRRSTRWSDRCLGEHAGRLASERGSALISYSYYGHSAFGNYTGPGPRVLFQLHPHPARVREILETERQLHPDCAESLSKEWELALPPRDFERLSAETGMADHWIVASSFTRETLIASGAPAGRIHVIPYGTNLTRFHPPRDRRRESGPVRFLFVGTVNQRKGIKYLLDAMRMLPSKHARLLVCGWTVDDTNLFRGLEDRVQIRRSVSAAGLVEAYQSADVFVFPSLAEGFGHVVLEAMASGLPVISTPRTAAGDLVRPGIEGYLTPPGCAASLAASMEEFLVHPEKAAEMGAAARKRAEQFTWELFRSRVGELSTALLGQPAELVHSNV